MKEAVRGQSGKPGYCGKRDGDVYSKEPMKGHASLRDGHVQKQGRGVYHDDTGSSHHMEGGAGRAP